MVRTKLQHEIGGYRPDLPHSGDLEMWLRFAAHSDVAFLRNVDQAYYRVHPSSMSRTTFAAKVEDLCQRRDAFDVAFATADHLVPRAAELRLQVRRLLAAQALRIAARAYDRRRLDQVSGDALEAFAFETWPAAERLIEHWSLRWRRRVGPQWCPRLQPLQVNLLSRKARELWQRRRWNAYGV